MEQNLMPLINTLFTNADHTHSLRAPTDAQEQQRDADWQRHLELMAEAKEQLLNQLKIKDGYWMWQNDEEDHLESLSCPILIEADELRGLLAEERKKWKEFILRKREPLDGEHRIAVWFTKEELASVNVPAFGD